MTDHSGMKLGRVRACPDPRAPALATLWHAPAEAPAAIDWFSRVPTWPMMANDTVGDCTAAAIGHVIMQWTCYTDHAPVVMGDDAVLALYSAVSGYVPGDPATDRGALCADMLRYWMGPGVATPDGGPDRLVGAASVAPADFAAVRAAIATFGNLYTGLALPITAQTEDIWAATGAAPGSWGGHCVPLVGFDTTGPICVTWGALKRMTWDFWRAYAEEAYALLSPDWLRATGTDPAGLDWAALATAMAAMGG